MKSKIFGVMLGVTLSMLMVVGSYAQAIDATSLKVSKSIGSIASISGAFIWAFNALRWFGWAGVIVGVGMAIFGLIYKLINTESEEAMKKVQGYVTKAVLIVVAGILLVSAGFIVEQVAKLFGNTTLQFALDS